MRSSLSLAAFAVSVISSRAFVAKTAAKCAFRGSAARKGALRMSSSGPAEVGRMNVQEFDAVLKGDLRENYQIIDVREVRS